MEDIDSQLYPQEVRPQNRGQSGIDEASDSSEEDATDTPGYRQDIPQTEKQNMKKARRSSRIQQLKDNTLIDLDEEQDISRTEAKPKRLVAVVLRRRPGFNPNDY